MERLAGRDVFLCDPVREPVVPAAFSTPQGSNAALNRVIGFTFEQRMKIMEMQIERDKLSQRQWERETVEREKEREEREKERVERKTELQYLKLKLEEERLKLDSEGRAPGGNLGVSFSSLKLSSMVKLSPLPTGGKDREMEDFRVKLKECWKRFREGTRPGGNPGGSPSDPKIANMVKLLPNFSESDPDRFKVLAEESSVTAAGDDSLMCSVSESTDTVSEELSLEQPPACANDSREEVLLTVRLSMPVRVREFI